MWNCVFWRKHENFISTEMLLVEFVFAFVHQRAGWADLATSPNPSHLLKYGVHQQLANSGGKCDDYPTFGLS